MSRFILPALALGMISVSAAPARADLIVNGSFESPAVAGGAQFDAGDPAITGWTIASGSVDLIDETVWDAYTGDQSLDLNGIVPAVLQQSFATDIGQMYTLSFVYADNFVAATGQVKSALVEVLGAATLLSTTITHSTSVNSASMNYTPFAATFVADSISATLRFTGHTGFAANAGIVLDAVSVAAVPEAGAWLLVGAVAAAGGVLQRFRRI